MLNQVILSSHYFPCIAYFAHLVKYPDIIIDTGENFLKQSYRNRCIIYTSNGPLALSIPVIKVVEKQPSFESYLLLQGTLSNNPQL